MSDMSLPSIADAAMTSNAAPMALAMKMGGGTGNIDKTAENFEAMFATQLLQPMFETVNVDPTFGGGNGEQIMRSFVLQEYGKLIAKSGKLGIASQVKSEMLRAQEGSSGGRGTRTPGNPYLTASTKGGTNGSVQ
jgi:flagellar protein FlgJ